MTTRDKTFTLNKVLFLLTSVIKKPNLLERNFNPGELYDFFEYCLQEIWGRSYYTSEGKGKVLGLDVTFSEGKINISPGVGSTDGGHMILLLETKRIDYAEGFLYLKKEVTSIGYEVSSVKDYQKTEAFVNTDPPKFVSLILGTVNDNAFSPSVQNFSMVDANHRSKQGSGQVSDSNPHGMSFWDLNLENMSMWRMITHSPIIFTNLAIQWNAVEFLTEEEVAAGTIKIVYEPTTLFGAYKITSPDYELSTEYLGNKRIKLTGNLSVNDIVMVVYGTCFSYQKIPSKWGFYGKQSSDAVIVADNQVLSTEEEHELSGEPELSCLIFVDKNGNVYPSIYYNEDAIFEHETPFWVLAYNEPITYTNNKGKVINLEIGERSSSTQTQIKVTTGSKYMTQHDLFGMLVTHKFDKTTGVLTDMRHVKLSLMANFLEENKSYNPFYYTQLSSPHYVVTFNDNSWKVKINNIEYESVAANFLKIEGHTIDLFIGTYNDLSAVFIINEGVPQEFILDVAYEKVSDILVRLNNWFYDEELDLEAKISGSNIVIEATSSSVSNLVIQGEVDSVFYRLGLDGYTLTEPSELLDTQFNVDTYIEDLPEQFDGYFEGTSVFRIWEADVQEVVEGNCKVEGPYSFPPFTTDYHGPITTTRAFSKFQNMVIIEATSGTVFDAYYRMADADYLWGEWMEFEREFLTEGAKLIQMRFHHNGAKISMYGLDQSGAQLLIMEDQAIPGVYYKVGIIGGVFSAQPLP